MSFHPQMDYAPAQFHRSARKGSVWMYSIARVVLTLPTLLMYRVKVIGKENVPKKGALVLAPNHFSQLDHFFVGVYMRRKVRFMAKSQLFGPKGLTFIFKHGGVFPVRRGHRDEEAFKTAFELIDQGDQIVALGQMHARGRSTGIEGQVPLAMVFTVGQDGKLIRYESFGNTQEALEAVGLRDG